MTYTATNFKTKKALREALARGEKIKVYQPNARQWGAQTLLPPNGTVFLEGPHYPAPHTWYAQGTMEDGYLVKIK